MTGIRTLSRAERELELAIGDAMADHPDTPEVDIWHDIVQAVALTCTEAVGRELCRVHGITYPRRPPAPSAAELAAAAERKRVAELPPLTDEQRARIEGRMAERRREARW